MRTLQPPNRLRIGIIGLVLVVLVTVVGQTLTQIPMLFAQPAYYAQFTDTGQLKENDNVRIAGVTVGKVEALSIDGDHVLIKFNTGGTTIGSESRVAVKTDTILGKKVLALEPQGSRMLRPGSVLPMGQSTTPYQIYDAVLDVTKAASGWDIDTVKGSLQVLSQTVEETSPHLSAALDGVAEFSDTIGKRDEDVKHLLSQADKVAGVLGDRSEQIDRLLVNGNTLLAAFNQRGQAIDALLGNVTAVSRELKGLVDNNPNLNHVLEQLRTVTDLLEKHKDELADTLEANGKFYRILNETVASGPYFKVFISNFLPNYQIMQPFVDAAFKKRGLSPEEFYRNAGLPEFRYPDPNGTRYPNGAPPPAPPILEGTPEHPGPAVPPGSACSYAPASNPGHGPGIGNFPRPDNPLPCTGTNVGPYGLPGENGPGLPDVLTSPPNPDGVPASPGLPSSALPGREIPHLPGTPVPLPPNAPPGARTEPVLPPQSPLPGNPGAAPNIPVPPYPPGAPPAPPGPPGPGDQVPAPFIAPGLGGNSQPGGGGGAADEGR